MIEVIVASRCDSCSRCVDVCPSNVFDFDTQGRPQIARQADCQSCYLCELYCSADALYVGPDCEQPEGITEAQALASGTLGQYRRHSGWGEWAGHYRNLQWRMGEVFQRARKT
ncbi:ferredoxin family protein [Pseudomonas sp. dw_358]|uniref:4Fe-4S dicluster domain-containing protein n=1 Tax=Pseudomonas sp. dw_358 TaxID=2720083 RepID=UPI001BD471FB|nr:ferredoxin family protein [Pseudomonas sp. dw_358]